MSPRVQERNVKDWPPLVPLVCAVVVSVNLAAAVLQDRHDGYSMRIGILAGVVAISPFVIDLIAIATKRHQPAAPGSGPTGGLPLLVFPLPVLLGVGYLVFHPATVDVAPFVLVFLNGEVVVRSARDIKPAIVTLLSSFAVMSAATWFGPWDEGTFIWLMGIGFGWLGGYLVRELSARTVELQDAQAGLALQAAAEERSRIAREVHDVIAHSLSVTMLHVTAARMALETGKSTDAIEALLEAEQQGRRSLTDVRRTVGLLGPEAMGAASPMPLADDLPELVSSFRSAGLDIELHVEGDVRTVPSAAGLGVYRIVQESLTNIAKHAPGARATVDLDLTDGIRLRVHNPLTNGKSRSDGNGLGVRGMTERAALLGGTLRTEQDATGWTVTLDAPPAT